MTFLLRNWKAVVPSILAAAFLTLWLLARTDAANWRDTAHKVEAALKETELNFRLAMANAARMDVENVNRVRTEQQAITERTSRDYQADLAAARTRADALRVRLAAESNSRGRGAAGVPATGAAAGGSDAAASQDEFSVADRLTATEQAIQLDALQRWVKAQSAVSVGNEP